MGFIRFGLKALRFRDVSWFIVWGLGFKTRGSAPTKHKEPAGSRCPYKRGGGG